MSTLRVTVERLIVEPHPNADRLELAQVGLYRAVVGKDEYATGDYAVYIPEQAIPAGRADRGAGTDREARRQGEEPGQGRAAARCALAGDRVPAEGARPGGRDP